MAYRSKEGQTIQVSCPWPKGFGISPPTEVVFTFGDERLVFEYVTSYELA